MSSANRYLPHYTYADYLLWEGDWELYEGIPISMTPSPFGPHQNVALRIARELLNQLERTSCKAVVLQETDWIVCNDTVVRPDISVVCGEIPQQHIRSAPSLIIEILSNSTRERDLGPKRELVLEHGVEHYLVVDPMTMQFSHASRLRRELVLITDGKLDLSVCEFCSISLDLAAIFPK